LNLCKIYYFYKKYFHILKLSYKTKDANGTIFLELLKSNLEVFEPTIFYLFLIIAFIIHFHVRLYLFHFVILNSLRLGQICNISTVNKTKKYIYLTNIHEG
jgi:hypothetical protein